MAKNKQDLAIVEDLAKELAESNTSIEEVQINEENENTSSNRETENTDGVQSASLPKINMNQTKPDKKKSSSSLKGLAIKKQYQKLAERKVLLVILAVLLGIQLFFMNAIVLLIVLWSSIDSEFFRELNAGVLSCILDFTKYYVTAVLVELLGGIIYVVHRVFSDKIN